MKVIKIKAEWASINLNQDNSVIVCAKKNGTTQCVRFDSLDELKTGLDKRRVLVKKWAVAIPRSLCFLKPLTLPASDLTEALSMIEYELPSIIPIPTDEIVYSTTFLNKHEHMLDALICIVKQNTLNDYLGPIRAKGIEPRKIILSSLCVQNWINLTIHSIKEPVISAIINDHNCVVQTSIEGNFQKANELVSNENNQTELVKNVLREILLQRENLDVSIRENITFVLSGQDKYVCEVKNLLSSIEHKSIAVDRINIVSSPEVLNFNNSKENSPALNSEIITAAGLLDLAINSKWNYSNLISRLTVKRQNQSALLSKYIVTGILCLVFILSLWSYFFVANWRIERMCALIESQIDPIKDIAGSVDKKRQQVRAVQGQLMNRGRLTEIFNELYKYTPETISINKLTYVSKLNKNYIDIKGQADELATALDYSMPNAKLLKGMQVNGTKQITQANKSIAVFNAYCEIRNE